MLDDSASAVTQIDLLAQNQPRGYPQLLDLPSAFEAMRVVTRHCCQNGAVDRRAYFAAGGYGGLAKALALSPQAVIAEIASAGLRGRGGAGFPTAEKLRACQQAHGDQKYAICNAAEGDSNAYSIRFLLANDPFVVIEGLAIAAYTVGASRAILYTNAQDSTLTTSVQSALRQMEAHGLIGDHILGSDFSLHWELRAEACGFVYGEETAMLRVLEGSRAMPSTRPPFPAVSGLNEQPTFIANAETLANLSAIMERGAQWYTSIGTPASPGTKLFTLAGGVARSGIVEVPMGTTLRQLVDAVGGGLLDGHMLKAILIGGLTGGFISPSGLDTPLDYESLAAQGTVFGSGLVFVADTATCIVDLTRRLLAFAQAASCGKCVLCREGTWQLQAILTDMTEGRAKPEDLDLLSELGEGMHTGASCGLGRSAPNPVLTSLAHFREEYEAHVKRKRCPALVCKQYITYHILGEKCQGCGICLAQCPVNAISGSPGMIHVIDQTECLKCGNCLVACPVDISAILKAGGVKPRTPDEPMPVGSWRKR